MFPDFIPEPLLWALGLSAAIMAMATHAHADLSISTAATQNVSCVNAHCSATASAAVMNIAANKRVVLDAH